MQWSGLIGIGIATTLLTCCISSIAVILRSRSYPHELSPGKIHTQPSIASYQHLCYITERMSLFVALTSLLLSIASAFLTTTSLFSRVFLAHPSFMMGLLFCVFIAPNIVIPGLLYDLLGIFFVDAPALALYHGSTIEPKQAFILGLKSCVIGPLDNERRFKIGPSPSLLMLLLLEILGLIYSFRLPSYLWLIPLLALCGNLCYFASGGRYVAGWTTQTSALEQSPWAALVLHIDEWARLAGIKIQDIRVQTTIRVGNSEGIICGIFRPMLLLNNTFLAHSDWRQQEALLAWMIKLVHKRFPGSYLWLKSGLFVITWTLLATGVALLITLSTSQSLSRMQLFLITAPIIVFIMTIFIAHYYLKQAYFEADRFTANLTGDPLALIIALHTIDTLSTNNHQTPSITQKRIDALYQLTQQPGIAGQWNHNPVPSLLPFSFAEKMLTTPLDEAEDATFSPLEVSNIVNLRDYKTDEQSLEESPGREQT